MPIIVAGRRTPTDPTPIPPRVSDRARLMYLSPDNELWTLTGYEDNIQVLAEVTGLGAPPREVTWHGLVAGGGIPIRARRTPRTISLPLRVVGNTRADLRAQLRRLAVAFDPDAYGDEVPRPGTLIVQHADGTAREIEVHYLDGLEDAEASRADTVPAASYPVIRLLALEPLWRDSVPVEISVDTQISVKPLIDDTANPTGFLPIEIGQSQVLGSGIEITNEGDSEAYPIWMVTGPATGVTVRNDTTGKEWRLTYNLSAGQTITVDTRRTKQTATLGDGTDVFGSLEDPEPAMWPLVRGSQSLTLQLDGSAAGSQVQMVYQRHWRTA